MTAKSVEEQVEDLAKSKLKPNTLQRRKALTKKSKMH